MCSILGPQVQIYSQGFWTRTPDSVTIAYLDFNTMTLSAEQSVFSLLVTRLNCSTLILYYTHPIQIVLKNLVQKDKDVGVQKRTMRFHPRHQPSALGEIARLSYLL